MLLNWSRGFCVFHNKEHMSRTPWGFRNLVYPNTNLKPTLGILLRHPPSQTLRLWMALVISSDTQNTGPTGDTLRQAKLQKAVGKR